MIQETVRKNSARSISPCLGTRVGIDFVNAISVIGIGLSTSWITTLSFQFLNGLFMPCIYIGINTLILQMSEEEYVGRVNGVLNPLFMGAMVITMSFAGWFKVKFSLVTMYELSGILFFVGMLLTVLLLNVIVRQK
jgi:MFS family permease